MLIYQTNHPVFIHGNKIKGVDTRMTNGFSGLDEDMNKWRNKVVKKNPDAEVVMVFHSASNVNHDGKPCLAYGAEIPTLIMFVRQAYVDVSVEPLYLVDKMETISMDAHTYTKMSCHLATDAKVERDFWTQSFAIITDQSLIDKLEWNKIT
jgi:hypothetical protein